MKNEFVLYVFTVTSFGKSITPPAVTSVRLPKRQKQISLINEPKGFVHLQDFLEQCT